MRVQVLAKLTMTTLHTYMPSQTRSTISRSLPPCPRPGRLFCPPTALATSRARSLPPSHLIHPRSALLRCRPPCPRAHPRPSARSRESAGRASPSELKPQRRASRSSQRAHAHCCPLEQALTAALAPVHARASARGACASQGQRKLRTAARRAPPALPFLPAPFERKMRSSAESSTNGTQSTHSVASWSSLSQPSSVATPVR